LDAKTKVSFYSTRDYYKLDTHWRPAGQEAVAEFLAQTIVAKGLLPSIKKQNDQ